MKISDQIKKTGKATIKGPKVKDRKKFAPKTKVETPKKGKGAKKPKNETFEEDEESLKESHVVADFVEAVMEKRYADAHKFMNEAIALKIQNRIAREMHTPLF